MNFIFNALIPKLYSKILKYELSRTFNLKLKLQMIMIILLCLLFTLVLSQFISNFNENIFFIFYNLCNVCIYKILGYCGHICMHLDGL